MRRTRRLCPEPRAFARGAAAVFALSIVSSCGGGGGAGGEVGALGSLSFRASWEQSDTDVTAGAFAGAIPAAARTIRITFTSPNPEAPLNCCIQIRSGTPAYADRRVVLADLPTGPATVTIGGYPGDFAPADGAPTRCATIPASAAEPCGETAATPSYMSDPSPVMVEGGTRTSAGDIAIASRPFVSGVRPIPGSTAVQAAVPIKVVVSDTANAVAPGSIQVRVFGGNPETEFGFNLGTQTACDERTPGAPMPCTAGADLDTYGFVVDGLSDPLPPGPARVTVSARNDAAPARTVAFSYGFVVSPGATTTSTTSSTSSTTTTTTTTVTSTTVTSTTTTTTTTTVPPTTTTSTSMPGVPFGCLLFFAVDQPSVLSDLEFTVDYSASDGDIDGSDSFVNCLVAAPLQANPTYFDDESARVLTVQLNDPVGFSTPARVAFCSYTGPTQPVQSDFALNVTRSLDLGGMPTPVPIIIDRIFCNGVTTGTMPVDNAIVGNWSGTYVDDSPGTKSGAITFNVGPNGQVSGMAVGAASNCMIDFQPCDTNADCPGDICELTDALIGGTVDMGGDYIGIGAPVPQGPPPDGPNGGVLLQGNFGTGGNGGGIYQGLPPTTTGGTYVVTKDP